MNNYIKKFKEISIADVATVGGKNASLGEIFSKLASRGIAVPDGFTTTIFAFEEFLSNNLLHAPLHELMFELDKKNFTITKRCRGKNWLTRPGTQRFS